MRKVVVTIHPDGTVASGKPTVNDKKAHLPCAKRIRRAGKLRYTVEIIVSDEEGKRRLCAHKKENEEWEKRMAALPRPKPLHISGKQISPAKKKEDYYSSPESFKKFALHWASRDASSSSGGFEFVFSGEQELDAYGEVTMKLDDQSMKEIASVYSDLTARLTELVKAAKVVRVRKESHLSIVPHPSLKQHLESEAQHA